MRKIIYTAVLLHLILACSTDSATDQGDGGVGPGDQQPPEPTEIETKIVAHRGAYKEFDLPENSRASLSKALEIGVDVVECDVQLTKDEQLIVYHDEQVLGKFIKDQTYDELLGHSLGNGEKIPLLSEFLEISVGEDHMLWLDIKSLSEAAGGNIQSIRAGELAADLIRELNAEANVAYIVGRKAILDKCIGAIRGDWEIAYMNTEYTPQQFLGSGYVWANFDYAKFHQNRALMESYLNQGIKMSFYTIDDSSVMDWFLGQEGVYGITTNEPALLVSKMKTKN